MWPFNWRKRKWPKLTIDEIRRRARILAIDDDPFVYLDLFREHGFTIEHWFDVQDLNALENGQWDIIILDIDGVGTKISSLHGRGVLRHLRQKNPAQMIIAMSGQDWSLSDKVYFDLADASVAKATDFVEVKAKIDDLLMKRFSLGFYVSRIADLARPHVGSTEKIRTATEQAILRNDTEELSKFVKQNISDVETVNAILQVAQVAIGIMSLWR